MRAIVFIVGETDAEVRLNCLRLIQSLLLDDGNFGVVQELDEVVHILTTWIHFIINIMPNYYHFVACALIERNDKKKNKRHIYNHDPCQL